MGVFENEKRLQKIHEELCKALNLDKNTSIEAWSSFKSVHDNYVLEGDPKHWLGCAVYVCCKTSRIPTVGRPNVVVQGNLVSLTRLLKTIDLNIIDFFQKIRKWAKLKELPSEVSENVDKLEKNFNVSMMVFKKFQPIFEDIFLLDADNKNQRKKSRSSHVNVWQIFEFTWTLFLAIKSSLPNITDDLVNSYYLLLSVCDFIFANALVSGRKDLNLELFQDIPNINKTKFANINEIPSIIDKLCELYDGVPLNVKYIKEYCWKKNIKVLFDKNLIKGDADLLTDVISAGFFEANLKAVNKLYDEFILSVGCVDERVFLTYQTKPFYLGQTASSVQDFKEQLDAKKKMSQAEKMAEHKLLSSPLITKGFVSVPNMEVPSNPASVSLKNLLSARPSGPSDELKALPSIENLKETVASYTSKFQDKLNENDNKLLTSDIEKVLSFTEKMCYKLIDSIFSGEKKKPGFDPDVLINQEAFVKSLFGCSLEIILFTMDIDKPFTWILDVLEISPFHYYRIIEVVVRYEDALKRDTVKHLNVTEATILESLAWLSSSPLWQGILNSLPVPTCEDVTVHTGSEKITSKTDSLLARTCALTNSPGAPLSEKFLLSPVRPKKRCSDEARDDDCPVKVLTIENENQERITVAKNEEKKKAKRTGSVPLFFRKFYYLSSVRLIDMCNQLNISDTELVTKIWTCFELTITNQVCIMMDRHLDQLLMCSIYVVCKISGRELSFMDMMKCYRNQPQAQSHVYRAVLLSTVYTLDDVKAGKVENKEQEKGDIINFYNNIYIHSVKEYVRRLRPNDDHSLVLSPIPMKKATPVNIPKRISETLPIFLSGKTKVYNESPNSKRYYFALSPAKDLHAINEMVDRELSKPGEIQTTNAVNKKVKDLFAERLTMKKDFDLNQN